MALAREFYAHKLPKDTTSTSLKVQQKKQENSQQLLAILIALSVEKTSPKLQLKQGGNG